MADNKILFVSQEIYPYLPSNDVSTLGKSLPQQLQGKKYEVRTFMPKFGSVNERRNQLHEVIRLSGLNIEIDNNDHPLILKVASMQPVRIQVYFIDNDDYFTKAETDIDAFGSNRPDNDERAIYFARGTAETVKKLRWEPTIIQYSGWISALTPLYMKKKSEDEGLWPNAKMVYCIEPNHPDMAPIDLRIFKKLEEDGIIPANIPTDDNYDVNTLHKLAIDCASGVVFLTDTPDPVLLDYVKEKNIPILLKEDALKGAEAFIPFYEKL